ncbi:FAD:protein FMN transferase (EC @ FAD:protein FMN transferase (EC, NqrBC-associated [Olavius sp. associated proteobacterium Delta 1]|nr:FAD:protein FMN transferase (EC @ FAD:protein FMN transferase (EC, NqrBC-associated [Olavius sp. associated proteobacterium Delta 1]
MKKYKYILVPIFVLLISTAVDAQREHLIQGRTMGTTYHVNVVAGNFQSIAGLKETIDARLVEINGSMSTYQRDSEISRFNDMKQAGQAFEISADFLQVMMTAKTIFELSEGAWDGTVNPLVELWGFGRAGPKRAPPPKQEIAALLNNIGFENIEISQNASLLKKRRSLTLDLSSIAKGYGVDQVADIVHQAGFTDYLVEIGGEIFASGKRQDGNMWRIGINRPRQDAAFDEVYKVVDLYNKAFATSGDYRNFYEVEGVRYSHIIDPRTGYPVSNGVVSVSIIADNCTLADGLATAVMVMGTEKGLDLINRLEGVEGLIIIEKPNGSLGAYYSKRFEVVQ